MSQSIHDIAKSRPNEWIRSDDCITSDQKLDIKNIGGRLQWCACCDCFSSPNKPCLCGYMVLQCENKLFWGGDNGWVEDWKIHAEHYFALDSAEEVAKVLCNDIGTISIYVIHNKWQQKEPVEYIK